MIDSWIGRLEFLGDELRLRIALALLHFLWQGAAIGAVVVTAVWILRRSSASSRYALHSVALVCLPVCVVVTFATVEVPSHWKTLDVADELDALSTGNEPVVSTELTPLDSVIDFENGTQFGSDEERFGQPELRTAGFRRSGG